MSFHFVLCCEKVTVWNHYIMHAPQAQTCKSFMLQGKGRKTIWISGKAYFLQIPLSWHLWIFSWEDIVQISHENSFHLLLYSSICVQVVNVAEIF